MINSVEITVLARLIESGVVRLSDRNGLLIHRFETARWIDPGTRRNEWCVRQDKLPNLESRLVELLPSWRQDFEFLRSINRNPLEPRDIESLPSLRRQVGVTGMINRRTWNAAVGLGPKHQARLPAQTVLTKDWILRFRPNTGLRGVFSGKENCLPESSSVTECIYPERTWMKFEIFVGVLPKVMVTCENLGAYIDLPVHETSMVIYSPGKDIEAASNVINKLPDVPWIHFGDLDPEGIDIANRIAQEVNRNPNIFIPSFVMEYLPGRPVKTEWDNIPNLPIFNELKLSRKRIFQEVFLLDERLPGELADIIFR